MKKLLGFAVFIGILWFCFFSFQTIEARDSVKLSVQLHESQTQVLKGQIEIEKLLTKVDEVRGERNGFRARLVEAGLESPEATEFQGVPQVLVQLPEATEEETKTDAGD